MAEQPQRHLLLHPAFWRLFAQQRHLILQDASSPQDMALPGFRLHRLTGDRHGLWSVRVSGNWRIVFRFAEGVAVDVDLIDYH